MDGEPQATTAAGTRAQQIAICVPDNCGRLIGKRQPAARLAEATGEGTPMPNFHLVTGLENRPHTNFAVTGPHTGFRNGRLRADVRTRFAVPGEPDTEYFIADAVDERGEPVPEAPRSLLRAQIERLEQAGFTALVASELEFYLFDQSFSALADDDYRVLRPYHHRHGDNDLFVTGIAGDFLSRLVADAAQAGIVVDQIQGEGGPGQLEVNVRPADPLRACDQHAIFKHLVKVRAQLESRAVTFMAKPTEGAAGSGGHVHFCLKDAGGRALLTPAAEPAGQAAAFIAGVLAFAGDFIALYAPYANSYRRFHKGAFTPLNAGWAWENRSCLVRLTGDGASARLEFRLPGADANPYFMYSGLIASGLAGVEARLELPPAVGGDASTADLPALPRDLTEAYHAFGRSTVARAAFGPRVHDHLVMLVAEELEIERRHVTDWDRRRCFEAA